STGPELLRLQARIARLHLDLGDVDAAFKLIERVLRATPDEPTAYALLERLVRMPVSGSVPPDRKSGPPGRRSVPPVEKRVEKKKKKGVSKDVRHQAVRLLEDRCRLTKDLPGLARALEAALDLADTVKARTARLEELIALYGGELGEPERAFDHLSALVSANP